MKLLTILLCTLTLILNSCNSIKKQENKNVDIDKYYDIDNVLLWEDYSKEGKHIRAIWHTKEGKKYKFQLFPPYERQVKIFENQHDYDDFFYKNHKNVSDYNFVGTYHVCLLVSKKGKILDGRIIRRTEGCIHCDTLTLQTIEIMQKKIKAVGYDKKANTTAIIKIPFGKVYE